MAGVAIMAAVISAADSSFSLAFKFSICESQCHLAPLDCGLSFRRLPSHRVNKMAFLFRIN
jgi:hypothetical protein